MSVEASAAGTSRQSDKGDPRDLLGTAALEKLFRSCVEFEEPRGAAPSDFRVDRCWTTRSGGFRFQWSFRVGDGRRQVLFGSPAQRLDARALSNNGPARVTRDGVRGCCAHVPDYDLLIHSPDCDPWLPHLAACLDGARMAAPLAEWMISTAEAEAGLSPHVSARLFTCKPGRRAAIEYRSAHPDKRRLAGKTFKEDQTGRRLIERHNLVNERLRASGRRVTVPVPLAYLEPQRLVLFEWSAGVGAVGRGLSEPADSHAAVQALAAVHALDLEQLPKLSVSDELDSVARWQAALRILVPAAAEPTEHLLDALRARSDSAANTGPRRTIHGDFHEKQIILREDGVTVLDLDTLALGDVCRDLGNHITHVYLDRLRGGGPRGSFESLSADTLMRYEQCAGRVDARSLAF